MYIIKVNYVPFKVKVKLYPMLAEENNEWVLVCYVVISPIISAKLC